jgi:salicylate hydroxylase
MAIEDAAVLSECLDADDEVAASLERYETLRKPRTTGVQLGSRRNADPFHLDGDGDGDAARRRDPGTTQTGDPFAAGNDALFAYDAFAALRGG